MSSTSTFSGNERAGGTAPAPTIGVYVCTHDRNGPLQSVLESLERAAEFVADRAKIGVVVVDDNPDGRARQVVERYSGSFALGLHYRHVGVQNISVARNTGLEVAMGIGDWVAMTDDDCVVPPSWLGDLLDLQELTGADAVTGSMILRYPAGSADWIFEQPFAEIGMLRFADGAEAPTCATNNSIIRSAWLAEHPEIRFDPELGRIGGEDMVFFRAAVAAGLRARYSARAVVYGHEPAERATYGYQLRNAFWMGNTEFVTNLRSGSTSRPRLALRGMNRVRRGVWRPFRRMLRGGKPQLRFSLALISQGLGLLAGAAGFRVGHR